LTYDIALKRKEGAIWITVMEIILFLKIQYHFVFVKKYRYKVLKGDIGLKVRELIRQTYEAIEIEILKGVSCINWVCFALGCCDSSARSMLSHYLAIASAGVKLREQGNDYGKLPIIVPLFP